MRLARLNLTRYGKFTDFVLDFGSSAPGKPDFHLVYGPNEAGKTTTLSAYLDLLFGIEKNSGYRFLHPYDTMQVGGVLEFAGGTREFVRVKKAANSLLDGRGQIVAETALAAELGGLTRQEYRLKFSLDADTLETGGDNILASKGDLGELLFAASAGVADLSQKLAGMREDSEGFFRKGARKHELADLKTRIKELDEKKLSIDILASRYARLIAEKKEAAELYAKALKDREAAKAAQDRVQRLENALPRLAMLNGLIAQLESSASLPDAPPGWKEKLARLQKQETELAAHLKSDAKEIARLNGEIEGIALDEKALRCAGLLDDMESKRARFVTAEDISKLQPQVVALTADIAGVLRVLEREDETDPHRLLLGASITVALRALIEGWAGIETGLKNAEAELGKAQEAMKQESDKLAAAQARAGVAEPAELAMLDPVVAELRKAALEGRRALARKTLAESGENYAERQKSLAPWQGEAEELVVLRVPDPALIERWRSALAAAQKAAETQAGGVERLITELTSLRAQRDAFAATATLVSDGEAARMRAQRDAAWAEHRRALNRETADVFEDRLRDDDRAFAARLLHVREAAEINATLRTLMIREKELERARELCAEAKEKRDSLRAEIAAAIERISPAFAGMTLTELESWLTRREKALEAHEAKRKSERALREAEEEVAAGSVRLGRLLGRAGVAHDPGEGLDQMILIAQAALDEARALKTQADRVEDARRALSRREDEVEKARGAVGEWKAQWRAECGRCWIAQSHPAPSISLVREILSRVEELRPYLADRVKLEERIEKMRRDENAFALAAADLAREMGEAGADRPVLALADALAARGKRAREQSLLRATKLADLEGGRRREAEHREDWDACEQEKAEVLAYFSVETLAAAAEKFDQAKAREELLKRRTQEERLIRAALGASSIEEAAASVANLDPAALSTEKAEAENLFADSDARQREYYRLMRKAADEIEATGGDDAVALIEEQRRTLCLEIEDKARQWLRLRTGILSAERALRLYREKHRSSMLANASAAFATISRGAYVRLTTQPEGDGEVLVAVGADGRSKKANELELSKGTRFQLYLALRVAGYRESAFSRQPPSAVPFFADDIMETFDDFRAEEAFRLLAGMAEVGQVIYLTHHAHLCAIAQAVCPDVRIHRL